MPARSTLLSRHGCPLTRLQIEWSSLGDELKTRASPVMPAVRRCSQKLTLIGIPADKPTKHQFVSPHKANMTAEAQMRLQFTLGCQ